jgi:hypothetical protein
MQCCVHIHSSHALKLQLRYSCDHQVFLERLTEWLGSKATSYEERNYDLRYAYDTRTLSESVMLL